MCTTLSRFHSVGNDPSQNGLIASMYIMTIIVVYKKGTFLVDRYSQCTDSYNTCVAVVLQLCCSCCRVLQCVPVCWYSQCTDSYNTCVAVVLQLLQSVAVCSSVLVFEVH